MPQFNCSEIHYVDEHRVWMRVSTVLYCTEIHYVDEHRAPSMDAWQLAWHNVQIRPARAVGTPDHDRSVWSTVTSSSGMPAFMSQLVRMLQHQTQDVCRDTSVPSYHRWAEINCIKTIQIILVSYQFVTKCIWCLMYKWITSFFSWHSRHVEIVYLWSQFKHYCNGRSME